MSPTSSDARAPAPVGTLVGEYEVVGHLGSGGFGHVYSAVHQLIGKRAALKVLHAEHARNKTHCQRFIAEARAVNRIQHPGIVDIFAVGSTDDGRKYLAMELLAGESLGQRLKREGRLAVTDALPLLKQVAAALDAAHAAAIVHRDLKPDNIFLHRQGDAPTPKLLDFGIAKLRVEGAEGQTETGQSLGTPLYMSPEQWRGRRVDHRTDIYALGVVAYETITGSFPFRGSSVGDVMVNVCTTQPIPATRLAPHLPAGADAAFDALLAKEPSARPSSASEAVALLERALEGAGSPGPMPEPEREDGIPTRIAAVSAANDDLPATRVSNQGAASPSVRHEPPEAPAQAQTAALSRVADAGSKDTPRAGGRMLWLGAVAVLGVAVAAGFVALRSTNDNDRVGAGEPSPSAPTASAVALPIQPSAQTVDDPIVSTLASSAPPDTSTSVPSARPVLPPATLPSARARPSAGPKAPPRLPLDVDLPVTER